MPVTRIDQIAIAVEDLDAALELYERAFGLTPEYREVVESDGVEEAMLNVGGVYIQLLQATRDDSPIAKYLAKNGPGLHHLGLRRRLRRRHPRPPARRGRPPHRRGTTTGRWRAHGRVRAPEGDERGARRAGRGRALSSTVVEQRRRPRRPSAGSLAASCRRSSDQEAAPWGSPTAYAAGSRARASAARRPRAPDPASRASTRELEAVRRQPQQRRGLPRTAHGHLLDDPAAGRRRRRVPAAPDR